MKAEKLRTVFVLCLPIDTLRSESLVYSSQLEVNLFWKFHRNCYLSNFSRDLSYSFQFGNVSFKVEKYKYTLTLHDSHHCILFSINYL